MNLLAGCFIFFVSQLVMAQVHMRPGITVNAQNEVKSNAPIYLKDIASFDYVNSELSEKAGNLIIYEALAENEKLNLKNIDVLKNIRNKLSEKSDLAAMAWTYFVPENISIKASKNYLNPQQIRFDIVSVLAKKCSDCSVTIKELNLPTIKESKDIKRFEIDYDSIRLGGSFVAAVSALTEVGKKTYWLTGATKISKMAPVASRQINAGERIANKDFRMEFVDVTFAKDGVPTADELKNQVIGKNISVNQPIFKDDIRRELAIRRGQAVKIILGTDDFEITSQGLADEQGFVGDIIKFKNTDSQKWMTGQIVEPGVVRLQ